MAVDVYIIPSQGRLHAKLGNELLGRYEAQRYAFSRSAGKVCSSVYEELYL